MNTQDSTEQEGSDVNGSTDAVIEFDDGTVGFPEEGPFNSVVETFDEHGLGNEVSWKTIVTEVDHHAKEIIQVLDELRDLLFVTRDEHHGEEWYRMEDTEPMRKLVSKVTTEE